MHLGSSVFFFFFFLFFPFAATTRSRFRDEVVGAPVQEGLRRHQRRDSTGSALVTASTTPTPLLVDSLWSRQARSVVAALK
jgi:hypothetical protein